MAVWLKYLTMFGLAMVPISELRGAIPLGVIGYNIPWYECFVLCCIANLIPVGVITMIDNGRSDEKIIAIPFNDPNYNHYKNIDELPKHIFDEMCHFFTVYKNLENKETAVNEVSPREEAIKTIKNAIDHYKECFC